MTFTERRAQILAFQDEKGISKYSGLLDQTRPDLLATVHHAQQEATDLLNYLVWLETVSAPPPSQPLPTKRNEDTQTTARTARHPGAD